MTERFTRITWGPPKAIPRVTVYTNNGTAKIITGDYAVGFTDFVALALEAIKEKEKKEKNGQGNGIQEGGGVNQQKRGDSGKERGGDPRGINTEG